MSSAPCGRIWDIPMREWTKDDILRGEIQHNNLKLHFGNGKRSSFNIRAIPSEVDDETRPELLRKAHEDYSATPRDSDEEKTSVNNWLNLCRNPEEAHEVYSTTPRDSSNERVAFTHWLDLCSTPEEAREAYSVAPKGSTNERLAIERIRELGGDI